MIRAQHPLPVCERLLIEGDRFVETARQPVADGEVVAGLEGVGMVGAEDSFSLWQNLLMKPNGIFDTTGNLIGDGKIL